MVNNSCELEMLDDLQLRKLILEGDEIASLCLFRRYQDDVRTFLLKRGCQIEDVDDVSIISLHKIWNAMGTYDESSNASFRTWAFTIVKNTHIDWCKKYNAQTETDLTDETDAIDDDTPETSLIKKERLEYVESLLSQLSELDQKILFMKGAGMKYEEISKELGITLSIVKNRIHQAKLKLEKLSQNARKD